jgi:hypothetical protein
MSDAASQTLLIQTAKRWRISPELAMAVILRDEQCIYCGHQFDGFSGSRSAWPTWEHIVNDVESIDAENIALCCLGCNASKGTKLLPTWLASRYCMERGITKDSIAMVALGSLGRDAV